MLAAALASCGGPAGTEVVLPSAGAGIGFDDLQYSVPLARVLVPAGRSGGLDLVDPDSLAVTAITGFSEAGSFDGGHDDGPTSVTEGRGLLFVTDRTSRLLSVVDPGRALIVAQAALGAPPDYVRFVAATNELWVTEPAAAQIEIFSLPEGRAPTPMPVAVIPVANGPEALVIDEKGGRAFTHRWQRSTVVIDVRARTVVAEWESGCASSRGIGLDEERGFLFVACSEGTVAVLDAAHDGRVLSVMARGAGFDVIGYNRALVHLYLAGSACGCLIVEGVSGTGDLSYLGRFNAPGGAHCAVADDRGNAWVCDPNAGGVRRVKDPFAATVK